MLHKALNIFQIFLQYQIYKLMDKSLALPLLSLKTEFSKDRLIQYFLKSYSNYELLFSTIRQSKYLYTRPQPLRHPLIFYYGHTAVVYVNKLREAGLIQQPINQRFQTVFAVGVDQMSWDDLLPEHYDWPSVQDTAQYRNLVKQEIVKVINQYEGKYNWKEKGWAILLGIEHEMIHFETSAVIIRRMPIEHVTQIEKIQICKETVDRQSVPENELIKVETKHVKYSKSIQDDDRYFWDNEVGVFEAEVQQFYASKFLVSNAQYLQFLESGGYQNKQYWTEEGQRWVQSTKTMHPLFWIPKNSEWHYRALNQVIKMPWDWPVEVNNLEARAFCAWKSEQINKSIRLPLMKQYLSLLQLTKYPCQANVNLQKYFSCVPINTFNHGTQFYDIVGNVWQHLADDFKPLNGFQIHPYYQDFSSIAFDLKHDELRGGSWASTGQSAHPEYRNFFRRHFYQFSGIRYVYSDQCAEKCELVIKDEQIKKSLKFHYLQKSDNYINSILESFTEIEPSISKDKCLVIGCGAGSIVFEMSKYFKQTIGLDRTSRFFKIADILKQKLTFTLEQITVDISACNYNTQLVHFYQQRPDNIDLKKYNSYDLIIIDANACRDNNIFIKSLNKLHQYSTKSGYLLVNNSNALGESLVPHESIEKQLSNWKMLSINNKFISIWTIMN